MKHVLILVLLVVSALSADWKRVVGSSEIPLPPHKEVITSDTLGVRIRTTIFGFSEQDTTVEDKDFMRIAIPEELRQESYDDTTLAGKPQIPYVKLLVAVPDSAEFELSVNYYGYTLFEDYLLYPTPRLVFEHTEGCVVSKEVYTYDTSFYQLDTLYPGIFHEVNNDGHWRDQRVLELILYPVQYNPQKEIMYFYDDLDVEIAYSGTVIENENGLGPFEGLGREILLNYPGIDRQPPPHEPPSVHYYTNLLDPNNIADYLVVTHEDITDNETAAYWINELAQWRVDHNSFDVGIVEIQDVYQQFPDSAPDSAAQLRDFLVYAYDHWIAPAMPDGHFGYCLFAGDWDYVPTRLYEYSEFGIDMLGADEHYFRDFDDSPGDEIMLGRLPVKATNVQDLITIFQKTIDYEQFPDTAGMWRRRGLLIAPTEHDIHVTEATPYYADIGYDTLTVRYSTINDDRIFCQNIQKNLDSGVVATSYYGHGAADGWYHGYDTSWVKQLANGDSLSLVLSAACLTAAFQWDHPFYGQDPSYPWYPGGPSFGEHFLFNDSGGAVAFEGASRYTHAGPGILTTVLKNMLRSQYWVVGKAVANLYCVGHMGRDFFLLGDPALDLGDYTAFPDLPDLLVRPTGMDVDFHDPFPYPSNGDLIPVTLPVWNIGAVTAYDIQVKVRLKVPLFSDTATVATLAIDSITPRDSTTIQFTWDPTVYHLDNGQTIVLPEEFEGEIGKADFSFVVDPDNNIVESWEGNNTSRLSRVLALYPNEANWPKKLTPPVSQPAIGDVNGDGVPEVAVAGLDTLYVFDHSGNLLNEGWPQYFSGVHGLVLGDIDSDDTLEIVAVSQKYVRGYNHLGEILWEDLIYLWENYDIVRLPTLGRIEDNGIPYLDIVVIADPKQVPEIPGEGDQLKLLVYDYEGSLVDSFACSQTYLSQLGASNTAASVSDVNGDNNEELIVSYSYGIESKTEVFNKYGNVKIFKYGGDMMTSALVDVSDPPDRVADLIVGCDDDAIRAYDLKNDLLLWERSTEGPINSSPAVGDIHPTPPGVEITFGNDASWIHLREKSVGDPVYPWPYHIIPETAVGISPAIANIDGDTYLDVIVGANNNYIYALTYDKATISPYPLPLFGKPSSPIIGDIDGDRESELIVSSSDGYLHVWANRASKLFPYALEWPQFHHDYQRTGLYNWVGR